MSDDPAAVFACLRSFLAVSCVGAPDAADLTDDDLLAIPDRAWNGIARKVFDKATPAEFAAIALANAAVPPPSDLPEDVREACSAALGRAIVGMFLGIPPPRPVDRGGDLRITESDSPITITWHEGEPS